ncbi:hypothetical protein [Sphingobium sp. B12D2B]|uniref:hypothetical protein n=1 Tax=Sphingobium sp. B12D2B TaxID=2940577 RepID=UPI002225527F|nr:hypothetical protein [Sphingobium sp. B12D2B]MCW2349332.1 hypothetical protein [Sphingobium sp. B12D2B]
MPLTPRLASVAFAVAATFGLMPLAAAPAQAQSSLSISYRDYDRGAYHDGYREVRRDRHYRERSYRSDRRDWRRHDRGYRSGYGYNDRRRCWTETRWDRWRGERYRVRICR